MIQIVVFLETIITIAIVFWVVFVIYKQGQKQKLAVLVLLDFIKNDKDNKVKNITIFLQNRLHFPDDLIKKNVQSFLQKEILLLHEVMKLSSIDDKQLVHIYSKLQDLTSSYYMAKPPSGLNEDKRFKPKTDYEEGLSICQSKFIKYLEFKNLITAEIRAQIHAFDKNNTKNVNEPVGG